MEFHHVGDPKSQPSEILPPAPAVTPLTPTRNGGAGSRKNGSNTPGNAKKLRPSPSGISDFTVGTRLEAKDFNDKWYPAKIVEVDWEEEEIFIHFEKWSIRFDEWIPMDSSRIRPLTKEAEAKHSGRNFSIGDDVMATWTNNCKYPAKVVKTLPNDHYEVLFFDGFHKSLRGNKMSKMKDADFQLVKQQKDQEQAVEKQERIPREPQEPQEPQTVQAKAHHSNNRFTHSLSSQSQQARLKADQPLAAPAHAPPPAPAPVPAPSGAVASPSHPPAPYSPMAPLAVALHHPIEDNIGSKEQRKERKRKLNVAELFTKKRSRLEDKSASPSPTRVRNVEKKMSNSLNPLMGGAGLMGGSVVKLEPGSLSLSSTSSPAQSAGPILGTDPMFPADPLKVEGGILSPAAASAASAAEEAPLLLKNSERKRRRRFKKRKEGLPGEELGLSRKSGKGTPMSPNPMESSIRWEDGEPQGEAAYVIDGAEGPRKSIIVDDRRLPEGWSKHAIRRQGGTSAGKWDVFLVRNGGNAENGELASLSGSEAQASAALTSQAQAQSPGGPPPPHLASGHAQPSYGPPVQRVKTLLPKVRVPSAGSPSRRVMSPPPPQQLLQPHPHPAVVDATPGLQLSATSDGDGFKCPKEGCEKRFRKENLLQMHIKHYHPEYNRFMGSTPNVADLAYARTIGEPISELPSRNRANGPSFIEKISRFEAHRKAAGAMPSPGAAAPSPGPDGVNGGSPEPMSSLEARAPTLNLLLKRGPMRKDNGDGTIAAAQAAAAWMVKNMSDPLPPPSPLVPDTSRTPSGLADGSSPCSRDKQEETPLRLPTRPSSRPATRPTTPDHSRDESDMSHDLQSPMLTDQSLPAPSPSSTSNSPSYFFKKKTPPSEKHNADGYRRGEDIKSTSPVDQLRREELINCTCGYTEEDGLMIQCDLCLCWQHGMCNKIEHEDDVPEKYVCQICLHPIRERRSRRFLHDQSWLKDGTLPSFSFNKKDPEPRKQREDLLKRSHDLCGILLQMQKVIHSLRVKVHIAEQKDHPKLYLWANSWVKEPPPSCPTPPTSPVSPRSKSPRMADGTSVKIEPKQEHADPKQESDSEKGKSLLQEALLNGSPVQPQQQQHLGSGLELPLSETLLEQLASAVEDKLRAPDIPVVAQVPQPEAPIDPVECRLKLLDHIEHFQTQLDARLNSMEEQVAALESEDPDVMCNETADFFPQTKQTIQMLLRDLTTVRNFAALS